ncbi:hypothetical protein GGR53DRAFT_470995 [Hypoxylon sp. FL1150]|nr:hypothetical protein GGR53DRAFT_470995 [Hypoxylon sp. FL1150]
MDEDAKPKKLTVEDLDARHRELFVRALRRVLATDLAKLTYAQIIDGLPLSDTVDDTVSGGLSNKHPLYDVHDELCDGVMERTEQMSASFDPNVLKFDSQLLYAYQAASPGSRAFRMRLIELMAVAVHQIAVVLFQLDESLHKDDGITTWAPPKEDKVFWKFSPNGPLPTLFKHEWYTDYEQYPDGVADMVGYWAESRIFGGVVLFDRGTPEREADPDAVFFHPDRYELTYRIYQLLDDQKQKMLDFLLSDSPGPSPFPILADENNDRRVDPEEDIEATGIYRNIWERRPLPLDGPDARQRDVSDRLNYPTMKDWQEARSRCSERRSQPEL